MQLIMLDYEFYKHKPDFTTSETRECENSITYYKY